MSTGAPRARTVRCGEIELDALWQRPRGARAALVLAHGAGAGMHHPFMRGIAADLASRGVATLRFQFPYMQRGRRAPDRPALLVAAVRAAVAHAGRLARGLPLVAGGKSMGGRMTALAQAERPLPGVRGLVLLGYPLHPAGRPSSERAAPLAAVAVPMLFVQGGRDRMAESALMARAIAALGGRASRVEVPLADHGFEVPKRSGTGAPAVRATIADAVAGWLEAAGIVERSDAR